MFCFCSGISKTLESMWYSALLLFRPLSRHKIIVCSATLNRPKLSIEMDDNSLLCCLTSSKNPSMFCVFLSARQQYRHGIHLLFCGLETFKIKGLNLMFCFFWPALLSKTNIKQTMFCFSAPMAPCRLARKSLATCNLKYPKLNEWWLMSCFVCLRSFVPNRICKDSWLCSSALRLFHAPGHRNSLSSAAPIGYQK